jgi:hypothetical protein
MARLFTAIALMLAMSVLIPMGAALAFADDPVQEPDRTLESLRIEDIRLFGDKLLVTITDKDTGLIYDIVVDLRDDVDISSEYITIQLAEITGNASDIFQIRNPLFIHTAEAVDPPRGDEVNEPAEPDEGEPAEPDEGNPFTPDGAGTVVDNATDGDGKEFFVFDTPDGNVFYLIIDRQRTGENVYLLNAVTENDLMSLAAPGDGKASIVQEPPEVPPEPEPAPPEQMATTERSSS